MPPARTPDPLHFGEADLESELLGESDARCSYPPPGAQSEISMLRTPDDEQHSAASDSRVTLRAPAPSNALLELSGIEPVLAEREEPLRESREPFRIAVRDTWPESRRVTEPPIDIEEALRRAARSSFASALPEATDRQSGLRISAPHSIEEAVLRLVETDEPFSEPLRAPLPFNRPKA